MARSLTRASTVGECFQVMMVAQSSSLVSLMSKTYQGLRSRHSAVTLAIGNTPAQDSPDDHLDYLILRSWWTMLDMSELTARYERERRGG